MAIAVYGATGFVGRGVTRELTRHAADVVLVGRDPDRLAREAGPSSGTARRGRPPVARTARVEDAAELKAALQGCAVVVNCGPASICGDAIIQAALAAGAHYLDASGEQDFVRHVFDRYDAEAKRVDLVIVPAMGFDYAIGDCLARIAARPREPLDEVVIAYSVEGSDVAANSVRFAVSTPRGHEVVYRNREWRRVPFEIDYAAFDFPAPIGRRQMARYGSGEVITVPRHTDTDSVRSLITATSLCPHPALLPVFPILRPLVAMALRTPLARVLAAMTRVVPRGAPAMGERMAPRFTIAAQVRGKDGSSGSAVARGGDFHRVTACTLAWGALRLADGDGGGQKTTGVMAPAAAFDPEALLSALRDEGVQWTAAAPDPPDSSAARRTP
jgi:short subunit dehydrogenase-like uncharacterized protein